MAENRPEFGSPHNHPSVYYSRSELAFVSLVYGQCSLPQVSAHVCFPITYAQLCTGSLLPKMQNCRNCIYDSFSAGFYECTPLLLKPDNKTPHKKNLSTVSSTCSRSTERGAKMQVNKRNRKLWQTRHAPTWNYFKNFS